MRFERTLPVLAAAAVALAAQARHAAAQHAGGEESSRGRREAASTPFEIPGSMRIEHGDLHERLARAAKAAGSVGEAARALEKVLSPHFVREEQIALPPLGLLEPLSAGRYDPNMSKVLPLTDALRAELPRMLREHESIGGAAKRLEATAKRAGDANAEKLAKDLQLHALTEQEIFYPAALLVGDAVRARATP